MMEGTITKEQFESWKEHHVTRVVFEALGVERERWSQELGSGATLKGGEGTGEATAKIVGILYGLDMILKMEYEE